MPSGSSGKDSRSELLLQEKQYSLLATSLVDMLQDLHTRGDDETFGSLEDTRAAFDKMDDDICLALSSRLLNELGCSSSVTSWGELEAAMSRPECRNIGMSILFPKTSHSKIPRKTQQLEYLHILATCVQQRRLSQKKAEENTSDGILSKNQELVSSVLSKKLTEEQKQKVLTYFSRLEADYDQRCKGMQKRLELLQASFGVEVNRKVPDSTILSAEDVLEDPAKAAQRLAPLMERLREVPLSSSRSQCTEHPLKVPSVRDAEDRGGRIDDDSRVYMPEWNSEPKQPSQSPLKPKHSTRCPRKRTPKK